MRSPMNVPRDTTGVAPRGSTKVRRAESNTRSTIVIPSANHRRAVTTCMAVQLGRRERRGGDGVGGPAALVLALRPATPGVEPRLLGRPMGRGGPPGRVDPERGRQPGAEP